tara:strand:+ start:592 stop:795 length:204 start_codon:yes stop_codon:yes gene_type:complete
MKYLNDKLVEETDNDKLWLAKLRAEHKKIKADEAKVIETKAANKASAINKLKVLGLSDAEITAMIGE